MDIYKEIVPNVINGISNKRGDDFFKSITLQMSLAIGADYTFIASFPENTSSSKTIAVYKRDQLLENFEYKLAGTPCLLVSNDNVCFYPSGVCRDFPDDQLLIDMGIEAYVGAPLHSPDGEALGLIVALYETEISDTQWVASIFKFFAGRISAEMENVKQAQQLEAQLSELNRFKDRLEERVAERTQELERASSVKDSFLATMSHEIRTPMNGVLGMAELLRSTPLNDEQEGYLNALCQSGETMMTVINDILDYSKLSSGTVDLEVIDFSLEKWIDLIVQPFILHSKNNSKLSVDVDKKLPEYLKADVTRLHQILSNLLSNAIKFTDQGEIKLSIGLVQKREGFVDVKFSVTDTGIGISSENIDKIFFPFSQEEISTFRNYGGTGLGLSISKRLVEIMGGNMDVETQKGKGSCFSFMITFPVGEAPSRSVNHSDTKYYDELIVLLAEDNKINQLVAKGQLSKLGIQLTIANDGRDALNEYLDNPGHYDLILMDCEMPNLNGYEAARKIRVWEDKNNINPIPIYALTAHVLDENTKLCMESGMNGKLTKPVKLSDYPPIFDKILSSKAH